MAMPRLWGRLLLGVWVVCALGCGTAADRASSENVGLRLVKVYGEPEGSEQPASPEGIPGEPGKSLSGLTFGAVVDVAQGADGQVIVLDGGFRRLVGLDLDGSVAWTRELPEGEGPGEFREPWLLASVPGSRIAIFDQALNRIHYADEWGHLEQDPVVLRHGTRIVDMAFDRTGHTWTVPLLLPDSDFAALVFARDGRADRDAFPRNVRDREYSWGSSSGRLALGADGRVLYAHGQPGTWTEWSELDGYHRYGDEAFPGVTPAVQGPPERPRPMVSFPAWVVGIGELPGGEVAIVYHALAAFLDGQEWVVRPGSGEAQRVRHFLDLFDPRGRYLGTAEFPAGPAELGWEAWSGRVAYISSETGRILIPGHGLTDIVAEFEVVRMSQEPAQE